MSDAFTVYEKHPTLDAYRYGPSYTPYAIVAVHKDLSDAELAAEYQNSRLISYVRHRRVENYRGDMVLFDHYERGLEQEWFLERFATLPHAHETNYE